MSAKRRIEAFLVLADRGLRSARILLDDGQLEDTALFIQQVTERVARALLTAAGTPFEPQPWTDGRRSAGRASVQRSNPSF